MKKPAAMLRVSFFPTAKERYADRLSNAAKAASDVLYLYFLRSEIISISILEELMTSVLAYECKSVKPRCGGCRSGGSHEEIKCSVRIILTG